ncbi:uncharacterized protein [Heterodontus francisci]|uniref:uncharacterized protein n=1 Tax=Heterodontus francisci TaxID=7792 RepID=UPI00355C56A0
MWEQRSLSIVGKNLVIRCEARTLLLYAAQVWPIPHSCAVAVTRAIFRFRWGSKMDRVRRDTMFKPLDKGGKNVPNVALILMTTFVCGCIKLCVDLQYANSKCLCAEVLSVPSVAKDGSGHIAAECAIQLAVGPCRTTYLSWKSFYGKTPLTTNPSGSGLHGMSSRPCGKKRWWIRSDGSLSRLPKSFGGMPHHQNFQTSTKM